MLSVTLPLPARLVRLGVGINAIQNMSCKSQLDFISHGLQSTKHNVYDIYEWCMSKKHQVLLGVMPCMVRYQGGPIHMTNTPWEPLAIALERGKAIRVESETRFNCKSRKRRWLLISTAWPLIPNCDWSKQFVLARKRRTNDQVDWPCKGVCRLPPLSLLITRLRFSNPFLLNGQNKCTLEEKCADLGQKSKQIERLIEREMEICRIACGKLG